LRSLLIGLVVLAVPALVAAQELPPIGLPLPPIGLPLAPSGLSQPSHLPLPDVLRITSQGPVRDRATSRRGVADDEPRAPRTSRRSRRPAGGFGYVFVPVPVPVQAPVTATLRPAMPAPAPRERVIPPQPETAGLLRLSVSPAVNVRIHVDGYFAGTLDDLDGALVLEAGRHVLELVADGYERLRLPVEVTAGRTATWDGLLTPSGATLLPVPSAGPQAPAAPPPSTIYVIEGCYIGNVPPLEARLAAGCDPRLAVSVTPGR